jgi:uncharacterized protein
MLLVDTNVLVYAANQDFSEFRACRRLLEEWRASPRPWYTTWPILYEFLKVVTHARVLGKPWSGPRALEFVRALLAAPSLELLVPGKHHEALLAETVAETPGLTGGAFHDLHTAVLMREHGIRRIVTRDGGFRRYSFLEVVDPLKSRA